MKNILLRTIKVFRRNNREGSSDYGYYRRFVSRYNEAESYAFLNMDKELLTTNTEKDISFSQYLTFGSGYKSFIKKLGKPVNLVRFSKPFDRRILYYKMIIGGHRAKCEFHFYNDQLFFYTYTFPYLTEDGKQEILNAIGDKYLNRPIDFRKYMIADDHQNTVFIDDMTVLTVNYVAQRSGIFSAIDETKSMAESIARKKKKFYENQLLQML